MKLKWFFVALYLSVQLNLFSNSVNLFNNTGYKLKAVILSADGMVLDEVILDSRDASTWADDFYQFGSSPSSSRTPYTVNWYCMGGKSFGVCTDVSPGSVVLAQNCSGSQECDQEERVLE
jgi:hypothetical protein